MVQPRYPLNRDGVRQYRKTPTTADFMWFTFVVVTLLIIVAAKILSALG